MRVVTGEKSVDCFIDKGSIWLSINDAHGNRIAVVSCSREASVSIATMLLNAVQKAD